MSVSSQSLRSEYFPSSSGTKTPLLPLEPNSHQESLLRRGSAIDFSDYRRPSINDNNNLPLPSSISRRGSFATTDYEYSSRSPSPAPLYNKRHHEINDPFQRRHSIATDSSSQRNNHYTPKYRGFRFPSTIQESSTTDYKSFSSAPPSPPQLINHQQHQESLHKNPRANRPQLDHLLVRRASMPSVATTNYNTIPPLPLPQNENFEEEKKKETPYSRSPELRISHKLAERKRRKEMKELFDELRNSLPVDKNIKTSKWEILSKAVEYISLLKHRNFDLESELNSLRREIEIIKQEKDSRNSHLSIKPQH
ncbi:uncharacterized protein BX663DRAFT_72494 [Cokeromyces recurvatus]|uniref:uncharacterized protein n=1 Tax=Cokeromyces recurvatus TaxID=90255 RepID=UPI00221F4A31|nr:uncharacterized protein BX663DRAFT_72494 [Cokeromyces recurvatus]KAI7902332.1 hypothetical protein BX663DRAFT_72494 [Cokeromyces recurvatus]